MMLDPDDPLNFTHWYTQHLGIALRFHDVFTGRRIETPLRVGMSALDWRAIHRVSDASYRLVVTEQEIPNGIFEVTVESPKRQYVSHRPIEITLPSAPPYLQLVPLCPTRVFRVPVGETAIVGRLQSASAQDVGNLEVRLSPPCDNAPLPDDPFARSDGNGEFLYRLPCVRRGLNGRPEPPELGVEISRAGVPLVSETLDISHERPGRIWSLTFLIP